MSLPKRDRKIARAIIEKGLYKEFETGLENFYKILAEWKNKNLDNKQIYQHIYKEVKDFDKHIARRYDYMTGSKYAMIIAAQLADKVISEEDLNEFSERTREEIFRLADLISS